MSKIDAPGLDRSIDEMKQGNYKTFSSVDELFDDLDNDKDD